MYDFRGKRAELGMYDDAGHFTPEEREAYRKMLADNSFDTGLNIFNERFMSEIQKAVISASTPLETKNDIFTEKTFRDLVKTYYSYTLD